ncbi:calmodulin-binding protein 25-like [Durio zibethinus]|uniref:Calmodulin-binding protein 25-like n=1 Tax=Durio zibethinus TaxID=66656 RepID=A0A6P5YXA2_DURZI|nr:calmodulin-binding protein 25-like [Durio zibethinus]
MASLENLANIEPWTFRPSFADSLISEAFARDTETLTRALQKSISNSFSNSDSLSPLLSLINPNTSSTATPSASNVLGSDPETAQKRQRTANPPPTGKVSKRKSRSSKRSQTTFITADPANFRHMVQQVTGVRFGNAQMSLNPILKPEPQRPGSRLSCDAGPGYLPTLDTSAFLLDHQQPSSGAVVGSSFLPFQSSVVAEVVASTGATVDSDTFPSFPTLESWKV